LLASCGARGPPPGVVRPTPTELIAALSSSTPTDRERALDVLADRLRDDDPVPYESAVPILARLLESERDANSRGLAATCLGRVGPYGPLALPSLAHALEKDANAEIREAAAAAILTVVESESPTSGDARRGARASTEGALVHALSDSSELVRVGALRTLGKLSKSGRSFVPEILAMTRDPSERVRHHAFHVLKDIPAPPSVLVDALLENLTHDDLSEHENAWKDRRCEIHHLGELGTDAQRALPRLRRYLDVPSLAKEASESIAAIERTPK
jgi:hypothetical protein